MHDIRSGDGEAYPPPRRFPDVNLHPEHAGHAPGWPDPAAAPGGAARQPVPEPQSDWTAAAPAARPIQPGASYEVTGIPPAPEPAPPAAAPDPLPREDEGHRSLARSLRTIKVSLIALIVILALGTAYFLTQSGSGPGAGDQQAPVGTAEPGTTTPPAASGTTRSVSCVGSTGPDATTDSQSFQNVEGTECTYRTGPVPETLVLNGKLTGRNTEGTGMAATITVNGTACNGGESLNYARTYTPMVSNCVFEVPADSAVAIRWQFLSPFGGDASVLRSSKNIAPSIVGVAVPRPEEGSGE